MIRQRTPLGTAQRTTGARAVTRDVTRAVARRMQRGVMLIEALVAIAIFSFAILGIVGLQATAIRAVRDADYRAKASLLADQLVGRMWLDRYNVPTYALNADVSTTCPAGGNNSGNPIVNEWLQGLTDLDNPSALPGAAGLQHRVAVSANNTVTLTLCWQSPQDEAPHNFSMTTQIRG